MAEIIKINDNTWIFADCMMRQRVPVSILRRH